MCPDLEGLLLLLKGICDVVIRVGIISVEVGILFGRRCFCVCVGVKEDFLTLCSTVLDSLDKDRELSEAQAEIKALKLTERSTEKAFEEVCYCLLNTACFCGHDVKLSLSCSRSGGPFFAYFSGCKSFDCNGHGRHHGYVHL